MFYIAGRALRSGESLDKEILSGLFQVKPMAEYPPNWAQSPGHPFRYATQAEAEAAVAEAVAAAEGRMARRALLRQRHVLAMRQRREYEEMYG